MQKIRISELKIIRLFLAIFLLFAYQAMATISHLPPLLGVFFVYLIDLNLRREKRILNNEYELYFCIFYLILIEQTHGFTLFSSILGCMFFYYFFSDYLLVTLKSRILLIASFVVSGYIATFVVSFLFGYIGSFETVRFSEEILSYIAIEAVIAIVLFKERFA